MQLQRANDEPSRPLVTKPASGSSTGASNRRRHTFVNADRSRSPRGKLGLAENCSSFATRAVSAARGTGERTFWAWRIHGSTPQVLVPQRLLALGQKATAYTARPVNTRQPASRKAWPPFTRLHVVVRHVWSALRGLGRLAGVPMADLAMRAFIAAVQAVHIA